MHAAQNKLGYIHVVGARVKYHPTTNSGDMVITQEALAIVLS